MIIGNIMKGKSGRLSSGLAPVLNIMTKAESTLDASITLDFTGCSSVSPLFALALLVYMSHSKKEVNLIG